MLRLEHPADCIYLNKRDQRHFGVGLYCLEDADSQHRIGGISIYDVEPALSTPEDDIGLLKSGPEGCGQHTHLGLEPKLYMDAESGVVNFEWDPESGGSGESEPTHITCLCSDKSLKLFQIDSGFSSYRLLSSVKPSTIDSNNQIIGLDLSCIYLHNSRKTCYSISDGRVFVVRDSDLVESEFHAHPNTEVWTVSFLDQEGNLLATGADDCTLSLWDLRTSCLDGPAAQNRKTHSMGVTCIQKSSKCDQFWTGCYDETLRLWDSRRLNAPLYEHKVHGGIWRISQFEGYLGMALCYFGLEYLQLDSNQRVEKQAISLPNCPQNELSHHSIVYGIDTFRKNNLLYGLSCSFYDKTALLFQIQEAPPIPTPTPL
ncbi:hypothetical protein OIY81_2428 [Cryptosporidium canis]|uniref:methylated diphthine methylhydrolase n=1 Tax=Cryptosporidium canis TaxID=195482 RepID=A0ABQ8P960_9CRYT|nr:hypothetical protein OIY81_2428 [Cryptosporidium canis]KAJ1612626.1 hypothetical protein OJ252_1186 [Cryptosporidium canis]